MKATFCLLFCLISSFSWAQSAPKALFLFGGAAHKTFLGCLNCVVTSESSVCNAYGKFGSAYGDSIWNEFGTYGSEYNSLSPWNEYSSEAPIIVDSDGRSYGYFSTNDSLHDRTHIGWIVKLLDFEKRTSDLDKTRDFLCES